MLKRKIYHELVAWKTKSNGTTAMMIDGARRVGKSYIVEAFAKTQYKSYILIDFGNTPQDVLDILQMTVLTSICFLQSCHRFSVPPFIGASPSSYLMRCNSIPEQGSLQNIL